MLGVLVGVLALLGLGLGIWRYKVFRRRRSARIAPTAVAVAAAIPRQKAKAGSAMPMPMQMQMQPRPGPGHRRHTTVGAGGLGLASGVGVGPQPSSSSPQRVYSLDSENSVDPLDNSYQTLRGSPRAESFASDKTPSSSRPFHTRPLGLSLGPGVQGGGGARGLATDPAGHFEISSSMSDVSNVSVVEYEEEEIGLERIIQADGALAAASACETPTADANEDTMGDDTMTSFDLSFLPYNGNSEREKQRAEQARQHAADTEWYRTTAF